MLYMIVIIDGVLVFYALHTRERAGPLLSIAYRYYVAFRDRTKIDRSVGRSLSVWIFRSNSFWRILPLLNTLGSDISIRIESVALGSVRTATRHFVDIGVPLTKRIHEPNEFGVWWG